MKIYGEKAALPNSLILIALHCTALHFTAVQYFAVHCYEIQCPCLVVVMLRPPCHRVGHQQETKETPTIHVLQQWHYRHGTTAIVLQQWHYSHGTTAMALQAWRYQPSYCSHGTTKVMQRTDIQSCCTGLLAKVRQNYRLFVTLRSFYKQSDYLIKSKQ